MIGTGYANYDDLFLLPGTGNPQLHTIHENIVPQMTAIHNANISAYAVYVGNDTFQCKRDCEWAGKSAGSWLSGVGFTTYSTTDANKLEEYFQNISEWIQLKANAWTVTDPMGAMVDFEDFNTSSEDVYKRQDQLYTGEEFHVTLRDAANTSLSILKIMESAENGKPVLVDGLY